jgi:hypothetical protein
MCVSNEMDALSEISDFLVNNANLFPDVFFLSLSRLFEFLTSRKIHSLYDNEENRHDLLTGNEKKHVLVYTRLKID